MPKIVIKEKAAEAKTGPARKRGRPKKIPESEQGPKTVKKIGAPFFTQRFPLPFVFICSASGGNARRKKAERTKQYCRFAISRYCIPVAPQLMYPAFLGQDPDHERNVGNYCGQCLLDKCAEIWIFGDVLTNEMEWEIWRAFMRSKAIRWFTDDLQELEREIPPQCKSLMGPVVKKGERLKNKKEKKAV